MDSLKKIKCEIVGTGYTGDIQIDLITRISIAEM